MSRITGSTGSIQQTQQVPPNEVVTDNKDPDKLNNAAQPQGDQPSLSGEAKGMLDLGGSLVRKSLDDALNTASVALGYGGKLGLADINNTDDAAVGTALGYGGKLGIAESNNLEQPAESTALGYGGNLGILPEE